MICKNSYLITVTDQSVTHLDAIKNFIHYFHALILVLHVSYLHTDARNNKGSGTTPGPI